MCYSYIERGEQHKEYMAKALKIKAQSILKREGTSRSRKLTTQVTFTANELAALADYSAAGMLLLRISTPHRVIAKLKAALSRLNVPVPRGL
jgi:hypothetical protein